MMLQEPVEKVEVIFGSGSFNVDLDNSEHALRIQPKSIGRDGLKEVRLKFKNVGSVTALIDRLEQVKSTFDINANFTI